MEGVDEMTDAVSREKEVSNLVDVRLSRAFIATELETAGDNSVRGCEVKPSQANVQQVSVLAKERS